MGKTIPLPTERAYERIRHDIIRCVIAPATELSETRLCAQYNLGKASVRVALTRLSQHGLVRAIPRRGYFVMPLTLQDVHDGFELWLRTLYEVCGTRYCLGDPKSTSRVVEADKAST